MESLPGFFPSILHDQISSEIGHSIVKFQNKVEFMKRQNSNK